MAIETAFAASEHRITDRVVEQLLLEDRFQNRPLKELRRLAGSDRVRRQVAANQYRVDRFVANFQESSQEVLADLRESYEAVLRTAVIVDRERAFDRPRSSAVAHHSGQAVVYASFGKRVSGVELVVCPHGDHWGGITRVDRHYWDIRDDTPVEADFRRASEAAAGTFAERLFDQQNFKRTASLTEFMHAQTLADIIAQKAGVETQGLWSAIANATLGILFENYGVAREIMQLLEHDNVVGAEQLTPILAKVSPIPSDWTAAAEALRGEIHSPPIAPLESC
jgi:hypothetical protein